MTFGEIIDHLSKRGFVTRKLWGGAMVLFFGMDNLPWLSHRRNKIRSKESNRLEIWVPALAGMKATDWVTLPYFWDGRKDDFLPFKKKNPALTKLRQDKRDRDREEERERRKIFAKKPLKKEGSKGGCCGNRVEFGRGELPTGFNYREKIPNFRMATNV